MVSFMAMSIVSEPMRLQWNPTRAHPWFRAGQSSTPWCNMKVRALKYRSWIEKKLQVCVMDAVFLIWSNNNKKLPSKYCAWDLRTCRPIPKRHCLSPRALVSVCYYHGHESLIFERPKKLRMGIARVRFLMKRLAYVLNFNLSAFMTHAIGQYKLCQKNDPWNILFQFNLTPTRSVYSTPSNFMRWLESVNCLPTYSVWTTAKAMTGLPLLCDVCALRLSTT